MVDDANGSPSEAKRRTGKRKQARRDALIDATWRLVTRDGWPAITMKRVAQEADVTAPALYHYFSNKSELFEALALHVVQAEADELCRAIAANDTSARDAIEACIRTRCAIYQRHSERIEVLAGVIHPADPPSAGFTQSVYAQVDRIVSSLTDVLTRAQARGAVRSEIAPRKAVNVIILSTHGLLAMSQSVSRAGGAMRFPVDTLVDELVEICLYGVLAEPRG